jgi:hypothetical protein
MERRMTEFDKYLRPHSGAQRAMIMAMVVCVVVVVVAVFELQQLAEELAFTRQRIASLQQVPQVKPRPSKMEEERREQWVKLEVERKFNWYPIFVAVERASIDDIELREFMPDKANKQLTLRGEARNVDALIKYLGRLSAQPAFGQVYLSHQKNMPRDAMQVISFEVRSTLN